MIQEEKEEKEVEKRSLGNIATSHDIWNRSTVVIIGLLFRLNKLRLARDELVIYHLMPLILEYLAKVDWSRRKHSSASGWVLFLARFYVLVDLQFGGLNSYAVVFILMLMFPATILTTS